MVLIFFTNFLLFQEQPQNYRSTMRTTLRTTFRSISLILTILIWTTATAAVKKSGDAVKKSVDAVKKSVDVVKKSGEITVTCASCRSQQSELRGVQGGDVTIRYHIASTTFIVFKVFLEINSMYYFPVQTDRHKYTQQQTKQDTTLKSDAKSVRYGVFSF